MREVGREVGGEWRTAHAPPPRAHLSAAIPQHASAQTHCQMAALPQQCLRGAPRVVQTRMRRRNYGLVAVAAVAGGLAFAVLTDGGATTRQVPAPWTAVMAGLDSDAVLAWAGFGLDQISVAGHRFTPDGYILDALELGKGKSWRTFDSRAARDRIERLPWVATATLTRSYPGRLDVRVMERKAFGAWSHGVRTTLIDVTGRTLSDIRPGAEGANRLPRFRGAGADSEAAAITMAVARHPEIAGRLAVAERVAGRRWTLHLDNGTALHLPPDREAMVLDGLMTNARLKRLIDEPGRIVDLRAPGRIAVRAKSGAVAAPAPPSPSARLASGGP